MTEMRCEDGHRLHVSKWLPENQPIVGSVLIVHGMGEYGDRYAPIAGYLSGKGLAVYAPDLRGHGLTPEINGAPRGHFADRGGWQLVVQDIHQMYRHIRTLHPDVPVFLFGHSMGSLLSRAYLQLYNEPIRGAIQSAASGPMGVVAQLGHMLAKAEIGLIGARSYSKRMSTLLTGSFNRTFKPERTPFDWLTRDDQEVDKYIADDRITKSFSAAFYRDMIGGSIDLNKTANINRTPPELPMLFISGARDPLGDFGKGVAKTHDRYREAGSKDLTLLLYPDARHELLQELNREQVMSDIWDWIARRLALRY